MIGPLVLIVRLLALAALYGFLGFALWVLWKELRQTASGGGLNRVPVLRLYIRSKGGATTRRVFTQEEVLIGRDPLADVAVRDAAVSARHASLNFHDGHWWINDLGSKNGTRLNRERVQGPIVLTNGDEVRCGGMTLTVGLSEGIQWQGDEIPRRRR